MSSDEFRIIRINERTYKETPAKTLPKKLINKTSYQKVGLTRVIDQILAKISQPVSTFVSRRENQSSSVYIGVRINYTFEQMF